MNGVLAQIWPVAVALVGLTGLAVLRLLAAHRQRELAQYELARKVRQLREEYERARNARRRGYGG